MVAIEDKVNTHNEAPQPAAPQPAAPQPAAPQPAAPQPAAPRTEHDHGHDHNNLTRLCSRIDTMPVCAHIVLLNIIRADPNCRITENQYGVLTNLRYLHPDTIDHMNTYVNYFHYQESMLVDLETERRTFADANLSKR